ncbi:MAG: long-chain fatty acid--CoA ligase [Bryobacterales bacterium]
MAADTIPHRLLARARELGGNCPAVHTKQGDRWVPKSWAAYADEIRRAAKGLMALGVGHGDRICLLGFNAPEWAMLDLAAMMIGAVPAGIYTTCSAEEVRYILTHAEAKVCLVETRAHWEKVLGARDALPELVAVTMIAAPELEDEGGTTLTWGQLLARGADVPDSDLDARLDALKDDDHATFIYTSGTTGPPKAVILTHGNLAWTAGAAIRLNATTADDSSLSYLPLSHIAEKMFTVLAPATCGSQVYFATSFDKVADELREVQPTLVFGVPRVWEKMYLGVSSRLAEAPQPRKAIAEWAMGVGRRVVARRNRGEALSLRERAAYRLARRLVFSRLRPLMGLGRVTVCVSGAAPIAREVLEFFSGLDLVVQEVYGQSEDCGPTTFNRPGATKFGTVGLPLEGTEVRIADDGEILVKGPHVFAGYFKDPEGTAEVLRDGWLHSGDLGAFDSDGFLTITGRKKEILITAGGKNIAPANIEAALKGVPMVSQAVVIGDRRPYLVALLALDPPAAEAFAKEHGLAVADVPASEALRAVLQQGIDNEVNPRFAQVEHVRKFAVLPRELSIEGGELTPTMKVKRKVVDEHFADEIEALYASGRSA